MGTHEWTYLAASLALGAVPFGYILCFLLARKDIRAEGSGNIGATNVLRTVGPAGGAATLLLDMLKGALPVFYGLHHFYDPYLILGGGAAAILGHIFSPFLKFRGGKGVATFFGAFAVFYPAAALIFLGGFFVVVLWTRLVSAASLAAVWLVFFTHLFTRMPAMSMIVLGVAVLITLRHRRNILAIIAGTERRVRLGKPKNE